MCHDVIKDFDLVGRRKFLKLVTVGTSGLVIGSPIMFGCASSFKSSYVMDRRLSAKSGTSNVSFVTGTDTREMAYQALKPLEKEIKNVIGDKQVVIKVNAGMAYEKYRYYSTDVNQIRGILDFLKPVYTGKVIIAEGTASVAVSAFIGFKNYEYTSLEREYNVKLIDTNDLPARRVWLQDGYAHPQPINIIDLFFNPNIYMISATRLKTHGGVIVTLSLKNIVMGSPICHYRQKNLKNKNEKFKMHALCPDYPINNYRKLNYNIFHMALMGIQPDLAVLDGVVGIEGNGPWNGIPIEHFVAVASTDWLAADRLGAELMRVDYTELKYLNWCGDAGMGQDDLSKIRIIGPDYKPHIIKYKLHDTFEQQRAWIYEDEAEREYMKRLYKKPSN